MPNYNNYSFGCPKCGSHIYKGFWEKWECENPECDWERDLNGKVPLESELRYRLKEFTDTRRKWFFAACSKAKNDIQLETYDFEHQLFKAWKDFGGKPEDFRKTRCLFEVLTNRLQHRFRDLFLKLRDKVDYFQEVHFPDTKD